MKVQTIRKKFVEFFERRGHILLPPSSLIPADPTVLFTTAGMQQFKDWFIDSAIAKQKRVITIQPSFRTSDIEEVGDATHLTYFEMLGNFAFGDYGKKDAIEYALDWFMKDFGVEQSMLTFTYFGGEGELPEDEESRKILFDRFDPRSVEKKGKADNFWGPTGETGPCGPTVEFYYKGVEIWNLVFNEYYFDGKNYKKLDKLGVDTGAGLERIAATLNDFESIFETDELAAILLTVPEGDLRSRRIIADHTRAINALIKEGIMPSNKSQGAVLRRLIRRAFTHGRLIGAEEGLVTQLVSDTVRQVVEDEIQKFSQTLKQAMGVYSKLVTRNSQSNNKIISAEDAFLLQESYGLPFELTQELARKDGLSVDRKGFEKLMDEHREKSRAGVEGKFKGGLVEVTPETTKLHTAHHLLLAALRQVLGDHVGQRGSNITDERLRLDVSHKDSLTPEEIIQVERLVNEWISQDLKVTCEEMALDEAYKKGALGEFGVAYPEKVSVYSIGNPPVSIEICGGPHISRTGEIKGMFKIVKQESSGAGVRRIKGALQ